jgi:hypothetical protein
MMKKMQKISLQHGMLGNYGEAELFAAQEMMLCLSPAVLSLPELGHILASMVVGFVTEDKK